ncbi:MAG: DNA polymerase ligase N-terminal domain-containing protein [Candidatus Izemoplasmatales bacterium]
MSKKNLDDYEEKRDLEKSPEPKGDDNKSHDKPIFVIQKHDAQNLHYDFRLEIDGVLKSWAIPKGPSTDPSDKRLAIPTEDHPLDYATFEGVIPEDEYGGGEVIVWDKGTYENESVKDDEDLSIEDAYEEGHIKVWLKGKKLTGGYALIQTDSGDNPRWLLVKEDDSEADARRKPVKTEPKSVKSGKTIDDLKEEDDD